MTCVARGSSPAPDGARLVVADRDADDAFTTAERDLGGGVEWDAIIDLTRQPGHARRAVRDLRARHWVLVSSGSVYAQFDQPEQDETAELLPELADDVMTDMSRYGEAKVACENAYRTARTLKDDPATWTIIRVGLIGGRDDWSGRSGYYPWRFAHPTGPDVLVPPDLTFPTALIDVEGPGLLDTWRWFATMDTTAARAAGLRTRPLTETPKAALHYEENRDHLRAGALRIV